MLLNYKGNPWDFGGIILCCRSVGWNEPPCGQARVDGWSHAAVRQNRRWPCSRENGFLSENPRNSAPRGSPNCPDPCRRFAEEHQAAGIGERQRFQQSVVDHTEDGGVGANTQCERQHGYDGKSRVSRQVPQTIPRVLKQSSEKSAHGVSTPRAEESYAYSLDSRI